MSPALCPTVPPPVCGVHGSVEAKLNAGVLRRLEETKAALAVATSTKARAAAVAGMEASSSAASPSAHPVVARLAGRAK